MSFRKKVYDLPLLHLEGKDEETKRDIISTGVKNCFEKLGLQLKDEGCDESVYYLVYAYNSKEIVLPIFVTYMNRASLIHLEMGFGKLPEDMTVFEDMATLMNTGSTVSRIVADQEAGLLKVKAGIYLANYFDTKQFYMTIEELLLICQGYISMTEKALSLDETARVVFERFKKEIGKSDVRNHTLH